MQTNVRHTKGLEVLGDLGSPTPVSNNICGNWVIFNTSYIRAIRWSCLLRFASVWFLFWDYWKVFSCHANNAKLKLLRMLARCAQNNSVWCLILFFYQTSVISLVLFKLHLNLAHKEMNMGITVGYHLALRRSRSFFILCNAFRTSMVFVICRNLCTGLPTRYGCTAYWVVFSRFLL